MWEDKQMKSPIKRNCGRTIAKLKQSTRAVKKINEIYEERNLILKMREEKKRLTKGKRVWILK